MRPSEHTQSGSDPPCVYQTCITRKRKTLVGTQKLHDIYRIMLTSSRLKRRKFHAGKVMLP
jgi:hypothetical protein